RRGRVLRPGGLATEDKRARNGCDKEAQKQTARDGHTVPIGGRAAGHKRSHEEGYRAWPPRPALPASAATAVRHRLKEGAHGGTMGSPLLCRGRESNPHAPRGGT